MRESFRRIPQLNEELTPGHRNAAPSPDTSRANQNIAAAEASLVDRLERIEENVVIPMVGDSERDREM